MAAPTVCAQCDKPEHQCECDRYCCLCQAVFTIRLCVDGQYYCPDCREAMDLREAETHGH